MYIILKYTRSCAHAFGTHIQSAVHVLYLAPNFESQLQTSMLNSTYNITMMYMDAMVLTW